MYFFFFFLFLVKKEKKTVKLSFFLFLFFFFDGTSILIIFPPKIYFGKKKGFIFCIEWLNKFATTQASAIIILGIHSSKYEGKLSWMNLSQNFQGKHEMKKINQLMNSVGGEVILNCSSGHLWFNMIWYLNAKEFV